MGAGNISSAFPGEALNNLSKKISADRANRIGVTEIYLICLREDWEVGRALPEVLKGTFPLVSPLLVSY